MLALAAATLVGAQAQKAEAAALPMAGPLAGAPSAGLITEARWYGYHGYRGYHYRPVYHRRYYRPYYRPYHRPYYRPYYRPYGAYYGPRCRTTRVWTAWGWRWKRRCW
jgi:hypothetical protein